MEPDEIIKALQRFQPLYPNDYWFNARLGSLLWGRRQTIEALSYLSAANAVRPSSSLHGLLGEALSSLGRHEEALIHMKQAVELNPHSHNEWEFLAHELITTGCLEEGIDALQKAVEIQPNSTFGRIKLGDALRIAGRHQQALMQLRQAIELEPHNVWAQVYYAIALNSSKRYLASTKAWEPLLKEASHPDHGVRVQQESERILLGIIAALRGQGVETMPLSETERTYLHQQALDWLRFRFDRGFAGSAHELLIDPQYGFFREREQLDSFELRDRKLWEAFWSDLRDRSAAAQR